MYNKVSTFMQWAIIPLSVLFSLEFKPNCWCFTQRTAVMSQPQWLPTHQAFPLSTLLVCVSVRGSGTSAEGHTLGPRARCARVGARTRLLSGNVEHGPDAQVEAAQHGAQLRLQVETHQLTQQHVVARRVRRKLKQIKYGTQPRFW